jgi:hypothetical protein
MDKKKVVRGHTDTKMTMIFHRPPYIISKYGKYDED